MAKVNARALGALIQALKERPDDSTAVLEGALQLARGEAVLVPAIPLQQCRKVSIDRSAPVDFMGLLQQVAPAWTARVNREWVESPDFQALHRTGPSSFDILDNVEPWYHPRQLEGYGMRGSKIRDALQEEGVLETTLSLVDGVEIGKMGGHNFSTVYGGRTLTLLKSTFPLRSEKPDPKDWDWRTVVMYVDAGEIAYDVRWLSNPYPERYPIGRFR